MEIVIGNKQWSTWSMRPWLVLKSLGLPFEETLVQLRTPQTEADALAHSPSGLIPVLKTGGVVIWDSLAICEYLAERHPEAELWPADPILRALARSAASEMHSGFTSLRGECSMDLKVPPHDAELSEATQKNIRRIVALMSQMLERSGGPYLAGTWSIADAFFTPVATRFRTYGVKLSDYGDTGAAAAYCQRLLETPEFLAWEAEARAEP